MTIHAYTEPHNDYPAYVNLSERPGDLFALTVRCQGDGGRNSGTIYLSRAELVELVNNASEHLDADPQATKDAAAKNMMAAAPSNVDNPGLRAHALEMALRTPGLNGHDEVLRAAAAYQAHIACEKSAGGASHADEPKTIVGALSVETGKAWGGTDMDFGTALLVLKAGHRVARAGWNGNGMWIAYTPGSEVRRAHIKPGHALSKIAAEFPAAPSYAIGGHIDMRAADGTLVVGWLPSQIDMLAEDWLVIDEVAHAMEAGRRAAIDAFPPAGYNPYA